MKLSTLIAAGKTGAVPDRKVLDAMPAAPEKPLLPADAEARSLLAAPVTTAPGAEPVPEPERRLCTIPVEQIDPNPLAPREIYTPAMIAERAEALRTQGQHDPIHVMPHPTEPGRYVICDGWTRVLACRTHRVLDALLAEVHAELTPFDAAWFGYQQNEERQQHCDFDRAMFYEKLIAGGESASEVARKAKLSKTMMSFYRAYAKLPPDVLEIVRQHPEKFGANAAWQLAKLFEKRGVRKAVSLAHRFAAEDQPLRWLANQVQTAINPASGSKTGPAKQIRYRNGFFKQHGDRFELSIEIPPERQAEFSAALEALLDGIALADGEGEPPATPGMRPDPD